MLAHADYFYIYFMTNLTGLFLLLRISESLLEENMLLPSLPSGETLFANSSSKIVNQHSLDILKNIQQSLFILTIWILEETMLGLGWGERKTKRER